MYHHVNDKRVQEQNFQKSLFIFMLDKYLSVF